MDMSGIKPILTQIFVAIIMVSQGHNELTDFCSGDAIWSHTNCIIIGLGYGVFYSTQQNEQKMITADLL